MVLEQAKPVQVLPPDTVLCLMNRKIFKKGEMTDRQQPENKWAGSGGGTGGSGLLQGGEAPGRGGAGRTVLAVGIGTCTFPEVTDADSEEIRQRRRKNTTSTEQGRTEGRGRQKLGTGDGAVYIPLPSSLELRQRSSCHSSTGICNFFFLCKVPKVIV